MNNNNLNTQNSKQKLPMQEKANSPDEQSLNKDTQKEKNKKKHKSALTAASIARSAVGHAKSHTITNKPGDFAHSGTNICYEN
jgi:hypothetical protein